MNIPTIVEANAVNCCGCDWPVCAEPRKQCQSITGTVIAHGFYKAADSSWTRYKTHRTGTRYNTSWSATEDYLVLGDHRLHRTLEVEARTYSESYRASIITGSVGGGGCYSWGGTVSNCHAYGDCVEELYRDGILVGKRHRIDPPTTNGSCPTPGGPAKSLYGYGHDPDDPTNTLYNYEWTYYSPSAQFSAHSIEDFRTTYIVTNSDIYPGGSPYNETSYEEFIDPIGYTAWLAAAKAEMLARMDFSSPACITDDLCYSQIYSGVFGGGIYTTLSLDTPPANDQSAAIYMVKSRYHFGVPTDYSTVEVPRSTWEMTWDLVSASPAWWTWYDGGMVGTEPDSSLTLSSSHEWVWGGSMASPWSDWYDLPLPEPNTVYRQVNVMITCWKSARLGNKPTAHGDQVALP